MNLAGALNALCALLSIGIGAISWINPKYTLAVLDLQEGKSTMGRSEVRASAGALFVAIGLGALWIGQPIAYLMLGIAWFGAAIGRLTSLLLDPRPIPKTKVFFAIEAAVGILLIVVNLP
jgi:hypothetical protein